MNRNDVISLYNILLNRKPESEKRIEKILKNFNNIFDVMNHIMNSVEFKTKIMGTLLPEKIMVFIHIPKTAGTYLRTGWLLKNVSNYFWLDEHKEHPKLNDLETSYALASQYALIGGHAGVSVLSKIKTVQPRVFMSVLRDPVKRIISFYNHIKNNDKSHPLHNKIQRVTLYDLLIEKGKFYKMIINEQVKYIVSDENTLNNLANHDLFVIGKQDSTQLFIDTINDMFDFKFKDVDNNVVQHNKGSNTYSQDIKKEINYEKALGILSEITQPEYELYDSLKDINVMNKDEYVEFCKKNSHLLTLSK